MPPSPTFLPPDATGELAAAHQLILTRTPDGWIAGFTSMDYPKEFEPRVAVHLWRNRGGAWEELGAPQPSNMPSFAYSGSAQWFKGQVVASFLTQGLFHEQHRQLSLPPWQERWDADGLGEQQRYFVEWKQHTPEGWKPLMAPQVTTNLIAPVMAANSQAVCIAWTALMADHQKVNREPEPLRTRIQCFQ